MKISLSKLFASAARKKKAWRRLDPSTYRPPEAGFWPRREARGANSAPSRVGRQSDHSDALAPFWRFYKQLWRQIFNFPTKFLSIIRLSFSMHIFNEKTLNHLSIVNNPVFDDFETISAILKGFCLFSGIVKFDNSFLNKESTWPAHPHGW